MRSDETAVGRCPLCDTPIHAIIIEYTTEAGAKAYSECPECRTVVHPE